MINIEQDVVPFVQGLFKEYTYGEGSVSYFKDHIQKVVDFLVDRKESLVTIYGEEGYTTCLIIAYLHDVLEDTDITYSELVERYGIYIAGAVQALSKAPGQHYIDYILQVIASKDMLVLMVKLADLNTNMEASEKYLAVVNEDTKTTDQDRIVFQRYEKYELANYIILSKISEKIL